MVRVVATEPNTTVRWELANSVTATDSALIGRARFVQINSPLATEAMKIVCDKKCVVMQYNPGSSLSTISVFIYFTLFSFPVLVFLLLFFFVFVTTKSPGSLVIG